MGDRPSAAFLAGEVADRIAGQRNYLSVSDLKGACPGALPAFEGHLFDIHPIGAVVIFGTILPGELSRQTVHHIVFKPGRVR